MWSRHSRRSVPISRSACRLPAAWVTLIHDDQMVETFAPGCSAWRPIGSVRSLGGSRQWRTSTGLAGGIPSYMTVGATSLEPGMLAAWSPNPPEHPEGVILLNIEHPVLRAQIEHFQGQFAEQYAEDVENDVVSAYGEIAVSKVAHSAHLTGLIPARVVEEDLRSTHALTTALLGLIAEDAVIAPRLGRKYGRRRAA